MRKAGPAAVMSDQASFIAAARRAVTLNTEEPRPKPSTRLADLLTQVSGRAPEVTAEQAGPPRAKLEPDANEAQGPFGALRRAMAARRRTMLIALAGLVVIIGSLQSLRAARSSDNAVAAIFEAAGRTLGKARAALPGGTSAMPQPPAAGPQTPTPVVASAVEPAQTPPPSPRPSEPAPVVTAAAPPPEAASALTEAIIAAPAKTVAPGFSPPLAANGFDTSPTASLPAAPVAPQPGNRLADAATNGQANAQYEMGVRLSEGRGMAQDNQAAQQWLDKAARQNLAPAQYRLAAMLERGLGGPKDLKRAQELYTRAATQGHVRAMHNLGVLSAEGVDGKPDYATAVSWFRKAADFGLRDSQYNLAILYARGMGVDKNLPVSWAWFTAAAAQGDADSAQKREDIAARLTPNQMAAARTMVEAYRPRTADPVINDVASPPGGWDAVTVTNTPKPTTPAPKAKVSKL
jgi:localization factor PodJL